MTRDVQKDSRMLEDADLRHLGRLLAMEAVHYRRLIRLARRQNSYMRRQDVDRIEANARDWSRLLPEADAARIERERVVHDMAARAGVEIPPGGMEVLLDHARPAARASVQDALGALRRAAAGLARQNELNRTLARFRQDPRRLGTGPRRLAGRDTRRSGGVVFRGA